MHPLFILVALLFISTSVFAGGNPVHFEKVKSVSKVELKELWKKNRISQSLIPVRFGVDMYEVIYETSRPGGQPETASGILFIPSGMEGNADMLSYNHGTQIVKKRNIRIGGEMAICLAFAADGYAVSFPDYLGLGKGNGRHLYQHAESEAQASVDLLRAMRNLAPELGIKLSDKLFLTGYSQGGHASMSTHKFIQENCSGEFKVTASSPMSGAYDMTGVQGEVMYKPYSHPGYLPYIIFSYNEVYNLYKEPSEILKHPYDTLLPGLFNGEKGFSEINQLMPEVPKDIFLDTVVKRFETDPQYPFRKALEMNNVYDWKSEAPVQLCYCKADEQVSYKNALKAGEYMKKRGSRVLLTHVGPKFSHRDCALFASMYTKFFFDSFRKGNPNGNRGNLYKRFLVSLAKTFYKKKKKS
jgi:hypothetical protein